MSGNSKSIGVAYSDQNLDGSMIGGTQNATITGTVGFFGSAVTTQPTSSNEAAPISTAPVSISATQWAFGTSTQAQQLLTLVTQLRADLVALGLIKGS
jgi:hypothetical protein